MMDNDSAPGKTHPAWSYGRWALLTLLGVVALVLAGRIVSVFLISDIPPQMFFFSDAAHEISRPIFFLMLSLLLFGFVKGDLIHKIHWSVQRRTLGNALLILLAVLVSLVVFELVMRPFSVVFSAAHSSRNQFMEGGNKADFVKDDELGFMPVMKENTPYNLHGVKHNDYPLEKRPGWKRVLFMGDSIVAYGLTQEALRLITEGKPIEFMNAGVYGYSTAQEVIYFKRYNRAVKPDVVVLGFCLNDFDGTPVVLKDADGANIVVSPYLGQEYYHPWLFKNSALYRLYLSLKASLTGRAGLAEDVKRYLAELQQLGRQDGFDLKVVVYPILQADADWSDRYREQHRQILDILQGLGIDHVDLKPVLDEAMQSHDLRWVQMGEGDYFHPSQEFSWVIAKHLLEKGVISVPPSLAVENHGAEEGKEGKGNQKME